MSTQKKGNRRRILRRIFLALGICLLLGMASFSWWAWNNGNAWLEQQVRERIATIIEEASVPGYSFSMDALLVDARTGHLEVSNVELDFEPRLMDSLRTGQFSYLFAARAGRIQLRGLSFWRLLALGEFKVEMFELVEPELSYLIGGKRVDLADPFARLDQGGGSSISLVRADTFLIRKAQAIVEDLGGDLPRMSLSDLSVEGRDVRIIMGELRGGVRLELGDASLAFEGLQAQLPAGELLSIGRTHFWRSLRSGLVEDLRLQPAVADSSSSEAMRSVMELSIDSIRLYGFDVDHFIAYQALRIGHLEILDAVFLARLDKTIEEGNRPRRPLPTEALREMPFMIQVDTLSLRRGAVRYNERDSTIGRWATISFAQLEGRFTNVTNFGPAILKNPIMEGDFRCMLLDSAQLTGSYSAELDGSDRFNLTATVQRLPMKNLNALTQPLLRVQVNGGTLHRLELSMEGDDLRAKGDLAMHYSDLLLRVEPGTPKELRHTMFGSVLETMLKEAYGGGLSADRSRSWTIERDTTRSLLTYLWHSTREGLVRNLTPEAMDRMRSMLRTDAELRREQRELRRQRKEERR